MFPFSAETASVFGSRASPQKGPIVRSTVTTQYGLILRTRGTPVPADFCVGLQPSVVSSIFLPRQRGSYLLAFGVCGLLAHEPERQCPSQTPPAAVWALVPPNCTAAFHQCWCDFVSAMHFICPAFCGLMSRIVGGGMDFVRLKCCWWLIFTVRCRMKFATGLLGPGLRFGPAIVCMPFKGWQAPLCGGGVLLFCINPCCACI